MGPHSLTRVFSFPVLLFFKIFYQIRMKVPVRVVPYEPHLHPHIRPRGSAKGLTTDVVGTESLLRKPPSPPSRLNISRR